MIQYNTKNNSFLKVHLFLKQKGIKNNAFFLELIDETLLDVDPFDEEHLTDEQKQRIIVECTRNFWYFIRECVRVPASGLVRYELNLGNLALSWCCINNLNSYTVMPRQTGKTYSAMVVFAWILLFGGNNTEMVLFAQQQINVTNNLGRIKSVKRELPSYLHLTDSKDRDGSVVDFKILGNTIMTQAPGRSAESADNRGRGLSKPVVQYDEFGFIPYIKEQYQASVLAQTTVARTAEKSGLPHFISITTTAAFLNNDSGVYAHDFFLDSLQFDEKFYDMSIDEVKELIRNEAKRNFIAIEYQYWDLGKDDDYFQEQCKALNYEQDAIDREVLNIWKAVSTSHPLGQEAIATLEKYAIKPVHIAVLNSIYRMKLYRDPDQIDWEGTPFIIAGDCSNNIGSDYSALVVLDPYSYEVIATIRTNMYSTMLFAKMIVDLMTKFFSRSILVLERNLNGATIIDRIIEEEPKLMSRIYGPRDPKTHKVKELGMATTEKSREIVYGQILKIAVGDSYDRIHDRVITEEIKALIRTRNGRIDHPQGGHDDLLISYLFARWFLMYGDDIERYIDPLKIGCIADQFVYGIGSDKKMRDIKNIKLSEMKLEEKKKKIEQQVKRASSNALNTPGQYVMDLKAQHDAIRNGTYNNEYGKQRNSDQQNILDDFERVMNRYQIPTEVKEDKGELYTLDDDELEYEEKNLDNADYQEKIYNANPKDIQIKKKHLDTENQFIRKRAAEENMNNQADIKWFFNHLI